MCCSTLYRPYVATLRIIRMSPDTLLLVHFHCKAGFVNSSAKGYQSLYHGKPPRTNCKFVSTKSGYIAIRSTRAIQPGTELFAAYSDELTVEKEGDEISASQSQAEDPSDEDEEDDGDDESYEE